MKNEYGIETINGYVLIPNQEMWEKYKEYFSIRVQGTNHYCVTEHKPNTPEIFPCIVDTEYGDGGDYEPDYWSHTFTYRSELQDKLDAFNKLAVEMGDMAYSRIELETEDISEAFFSFLRAHKEHIYDYFGRHDLFITIDIGDNYLIINEDLEDE